MGTFHGIYRAAVVKTADPLRSSRVQVQVPDVLGTNVEWALPCLPVGSRAVPKVTAVAGDSSSRLWPTGLSTSSTKVRPTARSRLRYHVTASRNSWAASRW